MIGLGGGIRYIIPVILGLWAFLFIGCGKLNDWGKRDDGKLIGGKYGEENWGEDKSDGDGKFG
jgi:hypothetical protein